jgi:hypothetical protein
MVIQVKRFTDFPSEARRKVPDLRKYGERQWGLGQFWIMGAHPMQTPGRRGRQAAIASP